MTKVPLESKYLNPSALIISQTPTIIKTVLGSCISVCLHDKKNHIGGMNHFMLPYWNGRGLATPKFGNIAMKKLVENMLNKGTRIEDLIAKVFSDQKYFCKNAW